jgi:hypothetical protein
LENHIGSNTVSGHWHIPLREAALLDFAIVFPESTETIERKSLSDTAGTCRTPQMDKGLTPASTYSAYIAENAYETGRVMQEKTQKRI